MARADMPPAFDERTTLMTMLDYVRKTAVLNGAGLDDVGDGRRPRRRLSGRHERVEHLGQAVWSRVEDGRLGRGQGHRQAGPGQHFVLVQVLRQDGIFDRAEEG